VRNEPVGYFGVRTTGPDVEMSGTLGDGDMARAITPAGEGRTRVRDAYGRQRMVSFERDGSILSVGTRGQWACVTITRQAALGRWISCLTPTTLHACPAG
jgi:hypothetical protein